MKSSNERAICVYPSILLSDEWRAKLKRRYEATLLEKDYKAWKNAEERYRENIAEIMLCGMPYLEIDDMNYDLEDIIRRAIFRNPDIDLHTSKLEQKQDKSNIKVPLDGLSEAELFEPMKHFND